MPDILGILLDGPVRREIPHVGDVMHRRAGPLLLLAVQLVHFILAVHVAAIIRQHLVVVAKVNQRIHQIAIAARLVGAEHTGRNLRQDLT